MPAAHACSARQGDIVSPYCPDCGWPRRGHQGGSQVDPHGGSVPDQLRRAPFPARLAYMAAESLTILRDYTERAGDFDMDDLNQELEGYLGGPVLTELINGLNECAQVWDRG